MKRVMVVTKLWCMNTTTLKLVAFKTGHEANIENNFLKLFLGLTYFYKYKLTNNAMDNNFVIHILYKFYSLNKIVFDKN